MNKTPTTITNTVNLGLSKADVGGKGNPPPDGDYRTKIDKVIYKPSTNPANIGSDVFIVEFAITDIRFQKTSIDFDNEPMDPAEIEERRSWAALTKYSQTAGRIKQFLFAVTGASSIAEGPALFSDLCKAHGVNEKEYAHINDPWDKIASLASSETNPFAGLEVDLQVHREETKKKFSFPVFDWRAAAGEAAA